ncbi:serine/threonine-protein phosphatase [bacterium]|nr:serine/threonine-protein phosphatase [candidate division CSSED10-310 bacterium]
MEMWKSLEEIKIAIDKDLTGESLSDMYHLIESQSFPAVLDKLMPPGIDITILFSAEDVLEGGMHEIAANKLFKEGKQIAHVTGTMDAQADSEYRYLYDKFGWRTIVYASLDLVQYSIPSETSELSVYIINNPVIFHSSEPDAIDANNFKTAFASLKLALTAMVLRMALTITGVASLRYLDSIPGALFIVTKKFIYDYNKTAKTLYRLPKRQENRVVSLEKVFDANILEWIHRSISNMAPEDEEVSAIFKSKRADNTKLILEAVLRRFKVMTFSRMHERMRFYHEDISMEHADELFFALFLRDITLQRESEKLRQEIMLAERMQRHLLPESLPLSDKFDVAADCRSAGNVGGDLYDVVLLDDGKLAVFLADAAGHGIDSALLAAVASGAFRAVIDQVTSPRAVLHAIDNALRKISHPGFVTAAYLIFDANGNRLEYGLAGHPSPVILREGQFIHSHDPPESLPMGVKLPQLHYFASLDIRPGDLITVFSDGLIDTRNSEGVTFEKTLHELLSIHFDLPLHELLKAVFTESDRFRGNVEVEDDLTALLIQIKPD